MRCRLVDDNGNEVQLPPSIKEVFLFSLVSEHYPALAFQASQSLKFQTTDIIRPPFVMDVFHLLSMDEDSCKNVHRILETVTRESQLDGKRHDVTLASSAPPCGISFHCNPKPSPEAIAVLETHCAKRKYQQRAAQWFGVSVSPDGQVQFGVTLDFPWEASDEMERLTADMKSASNVRDALAQYSREVSRRKLGRNDPCHCGSGRKYKKCCLS